MQNYLNLLSYVMKEGNPKQDRTGTGTLSIFGYQLRFNLQKGFPLLTTKKVSFNSVAHELLWFLRGATNLDYLHQHGVSIWDEWATVDNEIGPMYGHQWRSWRTPDGNTIDQLGEVIKQIKHRPDSRRLLVSAWNVADLPNESVSPQQNVHDGKMALAPCHTLFQFYVSNGKLSCQVYQRSCDAFLGLPFNIASYALLTHMIAQQCELYVDELVWVGGDVHLYSNHVEQAEKQLLREPMELPSIHFTRRPYSVSGYTIDDFYLAGYEPAPAIPAKIAV